MAAGEMSLAERRALTNDVLQRCTTLGFAAAGIATLEPSEWAAELRAWLDEGKHGEMGWLADTVAKRIEPTAVLPGARYAVMVADAYATGADAADEVKHASRGRVARYARGRDYHRVVKARLHALSDELQEQYPGHAFRSFVDTAPVPERELAMRAGLGWVGKHTLLIRRGVGSWFLLGGVMTSLPLVVEDARSTDHCGGCTRCIDACPTDAITPYSVDASRCVSYLTIEQSGPIDAELRAGVGDWLAGCDVCQEVCPFNRPTAAVGAINPAYAPRRTGFDLVDVLGWTEMDRRAAFASSSLKRVSLEQMKRNALVCLANAAREADGDERRRMLRAIEDVRWRAGESDELRRLASELSDELAGR